MPYEISPVEEHEIEAVTNVFCDAWSETTEALPHGPGGFLIESVWPGMKTPLGRKNAAERLTDLWKKMQDTDPTLFVKAYDSESKTIVGAMIITMWPGPSEGTLALSLVSRDYFPSDEDYEISAKLRADRNAMCWDAVKQLPANEKFMNLNVVIVARAYQGRGIGSMLTKHAVGRADREQANVFLHASEAPASIGCYEKYGFKTVFQRPMPREGHELAGSVPSTLVTAMLRLCARA